MVFYYSTGGNLMEFKFYEKTILGLFTLLALASAVWWGITGEMLAAASSAAFAILVVAAFFIFAGSALERRGAKNGEDTFQRGAEFARDLMGDTVDLWVRQQAAAQRTQTQMVRNDGAIVKAITAVATQYARQTMGWADDVARAQAAAQAAQAQPQNGWWETDPGVYVYDPADGQAGGDYDDWDPYGQGGGR